MILPPYITHRL
jgi:hypothetical protein